MADIIDDFLEFFTGELKFPNIFGDSTSPKKMTAEQRAADRAALKSFIENPTRVNFLTDDHARTELEKGVVGITYDDNKHIMSGLLITKNGYVVTNYDVVTYLKDSSLVIKTAEGKSHKVLRVCATSEQSNIAILKVEMDGPAKAMKYKFSDRRSPHVTFAVSYLTRQKKGLSKQPGLIHSASPQSFKVKDSTGQLFNQVLIERIHKSNIEAGAVVVTANGDLFGIATGAFTDRSKTTCTSWDAVLRLLQTLIKGDPANVAKK